MLPSLMLMNMLSKCRQKHTEETQVMSLIAQGMTNKEIATEMQCSISKIEKHISAMFKKAGVKRRVDLVAWWEKTPQGQSMKINASKATTEPDESAQSSSLAAEESVVIDLLGQGMTTDEIIAETQSSKRKIDKLLHNLFDKTKANNRTELVRWWEANKRDI